MTTPYNDFDPTNKTFSFKLDKYSCFKCIHGICSLELDDKQILKYPAYGDCGVNYCRNLYKSILQRGILYDFTVYEFSCGHYSVPSGQHRICICGRKGILVKVDNIKNDCSCRYCLISQEGYYVHNKNYIQMLFIKNRFLNPNNYKPDDVLYKLELI